MSNDTKIAFQGQSGAYSDMACRSVHPEMETLPCPTFADVFKAVNAGDAELGMIPIDNSIAGRVADIHHLLPEGELHIIAEHFEPIDHCLLGVKGATIEDVKEIRSHTHALPQCRKLFEELGATAIVHGDTAKSAQSVADSGDKSIAAIGSKLAAEIYGLEILKEHIEDESNNTTRFLVLSKEPEIPEPDSGPIMTTLIFRVRNIPAALYKAIGGFATNGISMTKLESYVGQGFNVAEFYLDIEGHPEDKPLQLAIEELSFFSQEVKLLGIYPAHPYRAQNDKQKAA